MFIDHLNKNRLLMISPGFSDSFLRSTQFNPTQPDLTGMEGVTYSRTLFCDLCDGFEFLGGADERFHIDFHGCGRFLIRRIRGGTITRSFGHIGVLVFE